ncbi:MAG: cobalt-precorrin 5A hydrolase [Clostridia bacterium]|nr:cobalt-precorrin 5A hydrolase [Clostridia bacterium]
MKLAVVALTKGGADLGRRIAQAYPEQVDLYHTPFDQPLKLLAERLFQQYQGIVFIMALGIVVRVVGPILQDKRRDPAVVCMDEAGNFVISVASGHLGGANRLTTELAELLGATPVITTATDVRGKIAFDVLARELDLVIEPFENLKLLNSALVNGEKIGVVSQLPAEKLGFAQGSSRWEGIAVHPWAKLSGELAFPEITDLGYPYLVLITNRVPDVSLPSGRAEPVVLYLRPRNLIAGVGCRRGIAQEDILAAVTDACRQAGKSPLSLKKLVSVDLKKDETGLLEAARELGLPMEFFDRTELARHLEDHPELSRSDYVKAQIGVGGVCEPAALLAGYQTTLVLPKRKYRGVTVALAEERLW